MKIHEYQGKEILRQFGVPVPRGIAAFTVQEAVEAAQKLGGPVWVVKAQIHAGGRGKGGGVKVAKSIDDVKRLAGEILGMQLKTHQTGPEGQKVRRLYIEDGADIQKEYYLSVVTDRGTQSVAFIASSEGGMDIEEVAATKPEALAKVSIDPLQGVDANKAAEIVAAAKFPGEVADQVIEVLIKLWDVFVNEDATLVEVNPLVRTEDGEIIALDGKVSLDENADFRHPGHALLEDKDAADPLEAKAKENDLNYVKLDGQVGIIGNGAGLVMSTLDVVAYAGENHGGVKPANFLDIGGGASATVMAAGLDVILGDEQVKSVFVNVFGGITSCVAVAEGIVKALEILGDTATKPLVVRLDGNQVEEGRAILAAANNPLVTLADTMDAGADKAAELANA